MPGSRERATFRSLANRNYRLYFVGQLVSMAGTFMQTVAQAWLVLQITGDGTALGIVTTLQFLPILLLAGPAGVIVDRYDRRRLYIATQVLAGATALVLGIVTIAGVVELWMIYALATTLGLITVVDQPTRHALVYDIAGPADVTNAISLNMAMTNTSRAVGPGIAGLTIALVGVGPCFLVNAASFAAVIAAVALMRPSELHALPVQRKRPGQFCEGLAYVRRSPELLGVLAAAALAFGLAWELDVVLPLVARYTFDGGAGVYGLMSSAVGAGAIVGGLLSARRDQPTAGRLLATGIAMAVALLAAAVAPSLAVELVVLAVVGATAIAFGSVCSARLQLATADEMRGRVMGLWTLAVVGSRPVGGPIVGVVGERLGPRYAMAVGAVGVVGAVAAWFSVAHPRRGEPAVVS